MTHFLTPFESPEGFVTESNRIEGIHRPPTKAELAEFKRFMALKAVTVAELKRFVSVYQPDARLRDKNGLDVRVANHRPPSGGRWIRETLAAMLTNANQQRDEAGQPPAKIAYRTHVAYEWLHPFTDGNGRSGRMLWAWQMRRFPLGFLHHFYYQTLAQAKCIG